jgi:hypothetical protein
MFGEDLARPEAVRSQGSPPQSWPLLPLQQITGYRRLPSETLESLAPSGPIHICPGNRLEETVISLGPTIKQSFKNIFFCSVAPTLGRGRPGISIASKGCVPILFCSGRPQAPFCHPGRRLHGPAGSTVHCLGEGTDPFPRRVPAHCTTQSRTGHHQQGGSVASFTWGVRVVSPLQPKK